MGDGIKENLLRIGKTLDKNLLYAKCFHRTLYHDTTINLTETKKVKTVPCYKHKLMRPRIGVANLQKILPTYFGHEIV